MGDSGVFYKPKLISALAESLMKRGIALLAFNNRGAHNSKMLYRDITGLPKPEQRYQAGTHYELITDCVKDIDGAVSYLQSRDYGTFYLAGHSTGANKICVYDDLAKSNLFAKYVLAGPGDDVGLNYIDLGHKKFNIALTYAQSAVKIGQPLKVMPIYSGMHPFSAQSAFDILNPDGSYNSFPYYEAVHGKLGQKTLFKEFRGIVKPTLVIAGSLDEATASAGGATQALEFIKVHTNKKADKSDFQLVPEADHSFHDYEAEFGERVATWLN
jgi:pimeloyl-ACP methyl ester carboxylesterase